VKSISNTTPPGARDLTPGGPAPHGTTAGRRARRSGDTAHGIEGFPVDFLALLQAALAPLVAAIPASPPPAGDGPTGAEVAPAGTDHPDPSAPAGRSALAPLPAPGEARQPDDPDNPPDESEPAGPTGLRPAADARTASPLPLAAGHRTDEVRDDAAPAPAGLVQPPAAAASSGAGGPTPTGLPPLTPTDPPADRPSAAQPAGPPPDASAPRPAGEVTGSDAAVRPADRPPNEAPQKDQSPPAFGPTHPPGPRLGGPRGGETPPVLRLIGDGGPRGTSGGPADDRAPGPELTDGRARTHAAAGDPGPGTAVLELSARPTVLDAGQATLEALPARISQLIQPPPPAETTVVLRLEPPLLGSVVLRVVASDSGRIQLHFRVDDPAVRDALASHRQGIESVLLAQGLSPAGFSVDLGGVQTGTGFGTSGQAADRPPRSPGGRAAGADGPTAAPPDPRPGEGIGGRYIDYRL
jgi:hypothetical protein